MSDIVTIENAMKTFKRGAEEVRAVDGVSLSIAGGDFLAVVGPSGSGKTTLLNLIGCVDRPTSGHVTVRGMHIEELSDKALATIRSTTIGFVFQQFFLVPTLTAYENVILPVLFCAKRNGRPEARARKLLDRVGLAGRADHLPSELSGGEMQRVALARALINKPEILLADEPTGNLDTRSAKDIAEILEELNETGLTIVMVTHNEELASIAARNIVLRDGVIVEERRLRPLPSPVVEDEMEEEAVSTPDYMPSSIRKKVWGSPRLAALVIALGAVMAAGAFIPYVAEQRGQWVANRTVFSFAVYRGNSAAKAYFGKPTVLVGGIWPFLLGLLLVVAGIFLIYRRQRLTGWAAIAIGAISTVLVAVNIILIKTQLGANTARKISAARPEVGLWLLLVVSIAAIAVGVFIVTVNRRGRPAGDPVPG
jgi:putative ABC transport system ATP-binding protein